MGQRLELQLILEEILGSGNVYFQPDQNISMEYPAIVYNVDFAQTEFGDNDPYTHKWRYLITYISRSPNQDIPEKIAKLRMTVFNRFFKSDGLNHYVYQTFF